MYQYAWLVLDIFAVLVLLCLVYWGASRGFIRTILNLAGYLVAVFLAGLISTPAAKFLYNNVVRDALRLFLTNRLSQAIQSGGSNTTSGLLTSLPGILLRIMNDTSKEVANTAFGGDTAALAAKILDVALEDPLLAILRGVCFFVVISLVLLIVRRFSWLFEGIYHIPFIGTANTVLGGIVGVVEAVILLYLIAVGLQLIVFATGGELPFLNAQVFDNTYIYRIFFNLS